MKRLIVAMLGVMFLAMPAISAGVDRNAVTNAINTMRANKNITALTYSTQLEKAARSHVDDMVRNGFFSHTGSDGSSAGKRLHRIGYGWCKLAENIGSGQRNLAEAIEWWSNSPPHRKNMLNRKVTEVALARGAGNLWVLVLASPGC